MKGRRQHAFRNVPARPVHSMEIKCRTAKEASPIALVVRRSYRGLPSFLRSMVIRPFPSAESINGIPTSGVGSSRNRSWWATARYMPRRQQLVTALKDLARALGVSLAALCLVELSLHLCGTRFDASLFQMDQVRGFSFRPGAVGWRTDENDILVRINRFGNRDRERSLYAAPGTLRIAVLGSSYTAALEVEQQETYTAMLERDLSRPGMPVEVLNFGVEGYGPAQIYYTLHDQVWPFHPQIIIDEVSLKICILTSTPKFNPSRITYPYFRVAGDSVVPDESSDKAIRPTAKQIWIDNHVRTAVNASDLLLLTTSASKDIGLKSRNLVAFLQGRRAAAPDPRLDPWNWTLVPPPTPETEQSWEILEGLTRKMQHETAAHGAEFWVVTSDDPFQVNPDPAVAETLRRAMGVQDLTYGDDRLEQFLSTEQVKHIHLEQALVAYQQRTGSYLHGGVKLPPGEGHWNALGHSVVAQIIAENLLRNSRELQDWERTVTSGASRTEQTMVAGR